MANFYEEIIKGLLAGAIDTSLMWGPFAASRYREASGSHTVKLSSKIPLVMREIGNGAPYSSTIYKYAKVRPFATVKDIYHGAGTYYFTAYAWLVAAEFGTSHAAKTWGLNAFYSTLMAGTVGGIIATPGEHFMVQGKTFRQIYQEGFYSSLYLTRGWFPTVVRELIFSTVSVSGIQSRVSMKCAHHFFDEQQNFMSNTIGALFCAPLLGLTQPAARVAATMQLSNEGFFSSVRSLNAIGREKVAALPKDSHAIKRLITFISYAYCPGGMLRIGALTCTGLIYGVINSFNHSTEEQEHSSKLTNG